MPLPLSFIPPTFMESPYGATSSALRPAHELKGERVGGGGKKRMCKFHCLRTEKREAVKERRFRSREIAEKGCKVLKILQIHLQDNNSW